MNVREWREGPPVHSTLAEGTLDTGEYIRLEIEYGFLVIHLAPSTAVYLRSQTAWNDQDYSILFESNSRQLKGGLSLATAKEYMADALIDWTLFPRMGDRTWVC